MSKKGIVFGFAMFLLLLTVPTVMASSETTVSYHVATEDVFPALTDINASVTLACSAVFNSSAGTVLPNNSTEYSITPKPGSGTLTVNYTIDRPLLKKSGSPSVSINSTWLLGDSPPITVYDDDIIRINVTIHGHLNGEVTAIGNGSATPSNVTWSTWETIDITVSADDNAQNGQMIQIQTATKYVVYFTVKVELIGIEAFTRDSPSKEVLGSPTIQYPIYVVTDYEAPVADAGVDQTVYTGDKVNFDGSGSTASEGLYITKYEWDFENDGIIDAQGEETSFTYSEKGQYTVVLKVTDNLGQSDTDTVIVNVLNRAPTASFTYSPTNPTIRDTVNFVDTSKDQDGTIDSWNWDFGDGATSTLQNPTHQYMDKGNFTVTLTVADNDGAQDNITQTVTIYNLAPTASFTYSPSEPTASEDAQFTDESTDPEGKLVSWLWDFGDGYTSTLRNPVHKYKIQGTFMVTLTVSDDEGVPDETSKTVTIKSVPLYAQSWIQMAVALVAVAIILVGAAMLMLKRRKRTSAKQQTI